MARKLKISRKDKILTHQIIFQLLDDFINESYSGRRTKKNGSRISNGTVKNYEYLKKALISFSQHSTFEVKLYIADKLTQQEKEQAGRYYKKFYKAFTDHMYIRLGYFDNYVGLIIKCLRSFFNYLIIDRSIALGSYHKSFYVPVEEIPIIALNQEQLNYMIWNEDFQQKVNEHGLEKIKDVFVFGCTVALRISDLLNLSRSNLVIRNDNYYINVKSQKTGTATSIKLPDYAVDIIKKYKSRKSKLLLEMSMAWFNSKIKDLGQLLPDNFEIVKMRERRGKQVIVYKDAKKRLHYKLADHITTHTMRRTAITTMLCLGMPEHLVRKISGHAANSKEFFRYVLLSQSFIDEETDKVFDKLASIS
jgi:integrase